MFKKQHLALAIAATLAAGSAQAELETSVTLKSEVAAFTKDGARNGQATSDRGDVFKFENTAQIFVNGDAGENSSWHGEFKLTRDNEAVDGLDGHEAYTQQDFLRELYVDTTAGDWDVRIGKQQVVWGTADGMKLLDLINPTDFRELNQNTMADARIPVWMVNAERYLDNGANVQVVVSQAKENVLSGLNRGIDTSVRSNSTSITATGAYNDLTSDSYQSNAPFVMKGADSITGGFNGFLNIVPDLGSMARAFAYGFGNAGNYLNGNDGAANDAAVQLYVTGAYTNDGNDQTDPATLVTPFDFAKALSLMDLTTDKAQDITNDGDLLTNPNFIDAQMNPAGYFQGMSLANFFPGMDPESGYQPNFDPTSQAYDPNSMANGTMNNYFTVGGFASMNMGQMAGNMMMFNQWATFDQANGKFLWNAAGVAAMAAAGATVVAGDEVLYNQALPTNFQYFIDGVAAFLTKDAKDVTGAEMLQVGFVGMLGYDSNLANYMGDAEKNSAFEYMDMATFATFDAFSNAKSQYVYNMPDDTDVNLAFRYKNTTANGLNYSVNYSYNYDQNPIINLSWRDNDGNLLKVNKLDIQNPNYINMANVAMTGPETFHTLTLTNLGGTQSYGGAATAMDPNGVDRTATLQFEQTVERAHNIGTAVDFAIDTESMGPVVLRGEFLYQKDVYTPIMDLGELAIGNMTSALTMQKGDRFKYVVGADVTVMTDMMVSAQFIQDRNLDYVDQASEQYGELGYDRFTTDYATMSLTNNFNKAEENKNFYSLFFSKPFGESGEGRWNNIFIYEEGGGKWNRFDVEYGMTDQLIGTIEYNKYWGDENTTFGQFENASNIQVGLKYLLQ